MLEALSSTCDFEFSGIVESLSFVEPAELAKCSIPYEKKLNLNGVFILILFEFLILTCWSKCSSASNVIE